MKFLIFLLEGKVQGVKMRRYVESAGKYFNLGGFVINTQSGAVYGEAWEVQQDDPQQEEQQSSASSKLEQFKKWIEGKWEPKVYTNIKPTRKFVEGAMRYWCCNHVSKISLYFSKSHPIFSTFLCSLK